MRKLSKRTWTIIITLIVVGFVGGIYGIKYFSRDGNHKSSGDLVIGAIPDNPAVIYKAFKTIETPETISLKKQIGKKINENKSFRNAVKDSLNHINAERSFCESKSNTFRNARQVLDSSDVEKFKNSSGIVYSRPEVEKLLDEVGKDIERSLKTIDGHKACIAEKKTFILENDKDIVEIEKQLDVIFEKQRKNFIGKGCEGSSSE